MHMTALQQPEKDLPRNPTSDFGIKTSAFILWQPTFKRALQSKTYDSTLPMVWSKAQKIRGFTLTFGANHFYEIDP